MSAYPIRLTGPDSIRAARGGKPHRIQREAVPFPWDMPDVDSRPVAPWGNIVAPATATATDIFTYQVPDGFQFVIKGRINQFFGQQWAIGSGDILWTLAIDSPAGTSYAQGYNLEWFSAEPFPVGSFVDGPFPVEGYLVVDPLHKVRVNVTTTAAIAPGAPNYFVSQLVGWIMPLR